jgi:replicative DNA helicase
VTEENLESLLDSDTGTPAILEAAAPIHSPALEQVRREATSEARQAGQTPPFSQEAEAASLGACLFGNVEAVDKVLQMLVAADFYRGSHGRIFEAITDLRLAGEAVDTVSVVARLQARGELERVGGAVAIASLMDQVAAIGNVEAYARIVKDKSKLRALLSACAQIQQDCYTRQEETSSVLDAAGERILNVAAARTADFEAFGVGWEGEYAELEASSQGRRPRGLQTPWPGFNRLTGGIIPGKVYVVAARPGVGKTAAMMNLATHLANSGNPCAFFSLEMEKAQLRGRVVAATSEIDGNKIERGRLDPEELDLYKSTMHHLKAIPLHFYYDPQITLQPLLALARVAVTKLRVKAIFIDYLQMLKDPDGNHHGNLPQEVTACCRRLFQFAHTHKVAVIEAAQLNRDLKDEEEPKIRHLKESGGIEECADVIVMLHPKIKKEDEGSPVINVDMILGKHRGGDTGRIQMEYTRRFLRFEHRE